ncbi:hypothetical protein ASPCAL06179 [Aspergillus calidoustus]|uniref:Hypervirulence associated protein TUDOR domain-containing protein n=1 Tax=Aspergillus calidoustus TaxID=454130 RepID=A0A0U5FZD6_ASPCI|nr:hypothetical protein ASPCAL06179 [Aspergillus calidoustus]
MPFTEGTRVIYPTENGSGSVGTVKSFENGIYRVEAKDGKAVELEEAKVKEFKAGDFKPQESGFKHKGAMLGGFGF